MSTSKGRRNQMNINETPSVWDPVPLRSLYHVTSGMITFNSVSDPNPDVQASRQLRDVISFNRRRVEMMDKNKWRDQALAKL